MIFQKQPYTLDRLVRAVMTVGLLGAVVWLLGYLSDVLTPFAIAFLLAYLINPLIGWVQKRIPNRVAAVFLSLLVLVAGAVALVWLTVPVIMQEIADTGRLLSALLDNSDLAQRAAERLPPDLWKALKEYAASEEVQRFFRAGSFWTLMGTVAQKVAPGVWGFITGSASLVMGFFGLAVVGLYLVFLLFDYQKLGEEWQEFLPQQYRRPVTAFVAEFESAMNRYFRAQALVASIVGVLFALGFSLIGLHMGVILGLFIGLLNMVPYLQLIGLIPAVLLALITALTAGTSFWAVLAMTGLVFVVVQVIQDAILVPRIMGKVTGLSPAMILLSLSVWGKLLGMFGLIIALPITCLLLAYYRGFLASGGTLTTDQQPAAQEDRSPPSE